MVEIFDLIYMQNETFSFLGGGEGGRGDVNSKVFMKNVLTEGGHIDIFSHIFTYLISLQKK